VGEERATGAEIWELLIHSFVRLRRGVGVGRVPSRGGTMPSPGEGTRPPNFRLPHMERGGDVLVARPSLLHADAHVAAPIHFWNEGRHGMPGLLAENCTLQSILTRAPGSSFAASRLRVRQ
jgi:hypothetical protein